MPGHVLRLTRDRLDPGARSAFPATNRVLYLLDGALTVDGKDVPGDSAWHRAGAGYRRGARLATTA